MTQDKPQNHLKQMKMSQLSKESGFKTSTIHYYLNLGLLDPPRRVGLNLFIYDETHLEKLKQIRLLKENENLPLAVIKEILNQRTAPTETLTGELIEKAQADQKKEQILKVATEFFSQRGYEKTKIADIADALRMSRGTFYFYFKDKRELFLECIERLTLLIVPPETWDDIRKERDFFRRQHVRQLAFQKAFPGFMGILNLLRHAMVGDDPLLAQKAKDTLKAMIQPLVKEHRRAIDDGVLREFDVELVGYFTLILAEMVGFRLMMDDQYTIEEGVALTLDFILNGILNRETGDHRKGKTDPQKPLGEAGAHPQLDINSLKILHRDRECLVEMTLMNGQRITSKMKRDVVLSCETSFGTFALPLKGMSTVTIGESE